MQQSLNIMCVLYFQSEEILEAPPKDADIHYIIREEYRDLPPLDVTKPV